MFAVETIEMIQSPNFFSSVPGWKVTSGAAGTFWFRLMIRDNLGERRYIPGLSSSIRVEFMRARAVSLTTPTTQTFSKNATKDVNDPSLWKIDLTADETKLVITGTVRFIYTDGGVITTINSPFAVKKISTGMGC